MQDHFRIMRNNAKLSRIIYNLDEYSRIIQGYAGT